MELLASEIWCKGGNLLSVLFGVCFSLLYFIYDGYKRVLFLLGIVLRSEKVLVHRNVNYEVSVLVTVHNEADQIKERLLNILNTSYPADKVEVLVASDGSEDGTDEAVQSLRDERIRLFRPEHRVGKTETQNLAIAEARGEIIVFSDADTRFQKDFLQNIVAPFKDARVGAVDGHLLFSSDGEGKIAQSQGYYWKYELEVRQLESKAGILAVASGACLAVRKNLFRKMAPTTGEDCIVPLDVVLQGYKVVHAADAIAVDRMGSDGKQEFKARVRMTLRNWQGTWSRAELLNPFAHPGYAFALWSHKILRWLSPFFLIVMSLSALIGAFYGIVFLQFGAVGLFLFYVMAFFGWWSEKSGCHIPFAHVAYSFMLANAGFLAGIVKAITGKKIYTYR